MKTCFKCNETKPYSEFYQHNETTDGYLGKCKHCAKLDSRNCRKKNKKYYQEYDKKRRQNSDRILSARQAIKDWQVKNPRKAWASRTLNNALRDGRILRGAECENCNSTENICGHHDDYLKPLEVRWLCSSCHSQWHADNGEGKNAHIPLTQKLKGVREINNKFTARIVVERKEIHLGTFSDLFDAICARKSAESKFLKPF